MQLQGHTAPVHLAYYSADGKWLLSGGSDSCLRVWDAETGECIQVIDEAGDIDHMVMSSDETTLITAGSGFKTVWDWPIAGRMRRTMGMSLIQRFAGDFEGAQLSSQCASLAIHKPHTQAPAEMKGSFDESEAASRKQDQISADEVAKEGACVQGESISTSARQGSAIADSERWKLSEDARDDDYRTSDDAQHATGTG